MSRVYGARHTAGAPSLPSPLDIALPPAAATVDQRRWCTTVRDQQDDRCVGEAYSGLHAMATGGRSKPISELGIWTAARARERLRVGDALPNIGCDPADAVDAMIAQGVYARDARDDDPSADTQPTTVEETVSAFKHKFAPENFLPIAIGDTDTLQKVLTLGSQQSSAGVGVAFGMDVDAGYESLNAANPVWSGPRGPSLGGHEQVCVGYIMIAGKPHVIVWNSWGRSFGDDGFAYIPLDTFRLVAVTLVAMLGGPVLL